MGFFKNMFAKAKGVLGRVWEGAKTVVPKITGVLSRVADLPFIKDLPLVSTINRVYKYGKSMYDTITGGKPLKDKIKDLSDDVVDVVDVIRGAPGVRENIDAAKEAGKKFITQEVKPKINPRIIEPVMRKLHIE